MNRCYRIALLLLLGAFTLAAQPAQATPPQPTYGTANVDGNFGEWNLVNDFFATMYRAGKTDKPIESYLYLRYDCVTHVMYVLVLGAAHSPFPIPLLPTPSGGAMNWIAIDNQSNKVVNEFSGDNNVAPDWAWIGIGFDGNAAHARGYECSFPIAQGTYDIIAHAEVDDGGGMTSAGPGFPSDGPDLVISCPTTGAKLSTWSQVRSLYR